MTELLATQAIILVAALIQGYCGFGFALVLVPLLLGLGLDEKLIVAGMAIFILPGTVAVACPLRRHIQWRIVSITMVALVPGVWIGAEFLKRVESTWFMLGLGALLVAVSTVGLLRPRRRALRPSLSASLAVGLASGALGGAYGTGGPPLFLYYRHAGLAPDAYKGTIVTIFCLAGVVRLVCYTAEGLMPWTTVQWGLLGIPAAVIGNVAGHALYRRTPRQGVRVVVDLALIAIGIALIARAMGLP